MTRRQGTRRPRVRGQLGRLTYAEKHRRRPLDHLCCDCRASVDAIDEYHDRVWNAAAATDLGRELQPEDFNDSVPLNWIGDWQSPRLRSRLGDKTFHEGSGQTPSPADWWTAAGLVEPHSAVPGPPSG